MSTAAKVIARERIETLLDDNSFVEIGADWLKQEAQILTSRQKILHQTVLLPDMVLSMES